MDDFQKYAFSKGYINLLVKQLQEARKEIGFLKSEIDELKYLSKKDRIELELNKQLADFTRMNSDLESQLTLERKVNVDLLYKNNRLTTDMMFK